MEDTITSGTCGTSVSDDQLSKRNRLMNEVVSLRRKVPKALIALDQKIQKKELKKLLLKEYTPDAVKDQLSSYIQRTSSCEGRRVLNWRHDLKDLRNVVKEMEEADALLKERVKNSVDFSTLMKKAQLAQEHLLHFNIAQKQLANENPLITRARLEGCKVMTHIKIDQEEQETLEIEMDDSVKIKSEETGKEK